MALKVGELFASFDLDSSGMNATMRTIENSMEAMGANMVSMGSSLQTAITAPIESFAKQALAAGMDFTAQMSTVEAISGATAAEMEKLTAEALKMGSTTSFTAAQAGEALEYMAMAGWKSEQMLDGLAPIMNLAAASGEDLGTTADIVTDALTAFGLKAEDAGHFADILAVASSNANTNVSMMGETFKYIAPVAGAFGYKAEDVAVAIGLMANSGIKASQAGTSLRAALSQMAKPSDKAESAMKKLGISLTKSNGEMKPFSELVQNLRSSFSGLSEAQQVQYAATIFGQEAMSGMLAIINASDEDIKKLTQSVNECDGATQRMADTVLDNATGDWTLFKSAVEGAQVSLFMLNEGAIRSVIQGMTSLVDRFNGASDASKQAALKLALVAAAMGPVMVFGG
ncbi:MAG: phage tail tape measure protein, partial [Candidatus Ventricola sp.]